MGAIKTAASSTATGLQRRSRPDRTGVFRPPPLLAAGAVVEPSDVLVDPRHMSEETWRNWYRRKRRCAASSSRCHLIAGCLVVHQEPVKAPAPTVPIVPPVSSSSDEASSATSQLPQPGRAKIRRHRGARAGFFPRSRIASRRSGLAPRPNRPDHRRDRKLGCHWPSTRPRLTAPLRASRLSHKPPPVSLDPFEGWISVNGHRLRHARADRRDVVALNGAGAPLHERAGAF
jgi:hypothetical protein